MTDEYSLFAEIKQVLQENYSMNALLAQYKKIEGKQFETESMNKLYSEICYLIALEYIKLGDKSQARMFADEAIITYKRVDTNTLENSVPILSNAGLPDIMHEGIVKDRILKQII